jgi:hypothetical protein
MLSLAFALSLSVALQAVATTNMTTSKPSVAMFFYEASSRVAHKRQTSAQVLPECRAKRIDRSKQRVRRALHTLSREERNKIYRALWVIHDTPTWEGRHKYGPVYRDYSDLITQHSVAVCHPEGDAAHTGLGFGAWHRAFNLVLENVLLVVDPSIGALPYWDMVAETRGFPMHTSEDLGSVPGIGSHGELLDGAFANWTVPRDQDLDRYAFYIYATEGAPKALWRNNATGTMRG